MEFGFQIDLAFLFEQPSVWRSLVQTLIVVMPLTVVLSGYASWRVGARQGLVLIGWALVYAAWMLWPVPFAPEFILPGRVISVIGWFWLLAAWARRAQWHDPLLLVANAIVVALLLALFLVTLVATIRDLMGWDIPV